MKMAYPYERWFAGALKKKLASPFVHILFGARQTGKSTLLKALLPRDSFVLNFASPSERSEYLADVGLFERVCLAMPKRRKPWTVFVDQAQCVPAIFDAVQSLYDSDKQRWRFVLCGSSARKLRRSGTNLLPGRSMLHHLYPLTTTEQPSQSSVSTRSVSPLPFAWKGKHKTFPIWDIEERLAYGALPGIVCAPVDMRADLLYSYSSVFLEEEIRREALVKDWGCFLRFLRLAARESGSVLNYTSISQEIGLSVPTVKSYYQLLEDMFIGFHIPAFSGSPRKNLLSTPRFCFFDLGVRNAASGLALNFDTVRALAGELFEQWVGIELWKRLRYLRSGELHYLRTRAGSEIDYIVVKNEKLIPIEVKWTQRPTPSDARHLRVFLNENPTQAQHGWIVCRCNQPQRIAENVTAIPWWML